MSGFENNIINAANALIRAAMHSPNYVAGVSGWTINKDGSAEFNNLNLRGTFTGTNWIMNADGLFFYNGTPALGNLNLAITNSNASGIDTYGNAYTPGGISIIALAGMANVLTLVDASGNSLFGVDASGNVNAQIVNTSDVLVNGVSIVNDIIPLEAQGIVARGWAPGAGWPATPIGTTDTSILELDQTLLAGRSYKVTVIPADFIPTNAATQYVQSLRATTDGSTPSTSSNILQQRVIACTNAALNHMTPVTDFIPGQLLADTLYRFLVTARVQAGTFQYQTSLEIRVEDIGLWAASSNNNNGVAFGTGGSGGGGSKQTYTKTYVGVEFASYYGATATYGSGANGQRSHNSTCYQGCSSGQINGTGDQYSFTRFNYGQIATDLGAGTINWVKLRLTNQHSWYNGGLNAIVGWSSYTGVFGDPLVPGAGTHFAQEVYHMNEGATVTRTMGAWLASAIITGFTSITLGTSAAYTNNTDLNNYGYFAGAGNVNTAAQLTINYTK
jgi:hypothetical protein